MACILGVLGARNTLTKQIIQDEILNPILDDLAVKPSRVLVPSEPMSSTYIECWATRNGIPIDSVKSDWVKNGRRAGIIRDAYIEKEATTLLIFEGPKSRYFLDLAERIAKRRPEMKVYVVESKGVTPILLEVEAAVRFNIKEEDEAAILTLPKMWASSAKSVKCLIEDD
jgi:hypothetical protein